MTIEANATGQLIDDVALTVKRQGKGMIPVYTHPHIWGVAPRRTIIDDYQKMKAGALKEVY